MLSLSGCVHVSGHSGHVCLASVAMFARPRWPMYVFGLGGHDECWPRWPFCTWPRWSLCVLALVASHWP